MEISGIVIILFKFATLNPKVFHSVPAGTLLKFAPNN
jgi:hypothetical protein